MSEKQSEGPDLTEIDIPKNFSIFAWARTIPLCNDLWLRMQAQNIAIVDITIIRPLELQTARKIFDEERSGELMSALNAVSQMWLFSLYEFMRTWRQRAKQILELAEIYAETDPAKQKEFLAKSVASAKAKEKHVHSGFAFYAAHISGIDDADFVESVRAYLQRTEPFFREVEGVRMNLAKSSPIKTFLASAARRSNRPHIAEFLCDIFEARSTVWRATPSPLYPRPHGGRSSASSRGHATMPPLESVTLVSQRAHRETRTMALPLAPMA